MKFARCFSVFLLVVILTGCIPETISGPVILVQSTPTPIPPTPQPQPTRPAYTPGQLVDYTAQTGDTLPAIAAHFNTTEAEIRDANPIIPLTATTMPPGLPMKIPIYFRPFWGTSYQIIPDSLFVNGPAQVGFDTVKFVQNQPGWFKTYQFFVDNTTLQGGQLIDWLATTYSISPRLLLAIVEYQTGALTNPKAPETDEGYPLGFHDDQTKGLFRQLIWASGNLNNGYYGWRAGLLQQINHLDGTIENPDPWQNAATVALQYYFSLILPKSNYDQAIYSQGIAFTYKTLFGDPWKDVKPHIPGSLLQPAMNLPFTPGRTWSFTGGPHTGWGSGEPFAALDFAPPTVVGGCVSTPEFATAVANGIIARTGPAIAVLDLDGDGDERTGWDVFYLHLATEDKITAGTIVKIGDKMGHPSCEGGRATGTHVHIVRKYNGEWILAYGPLAFNLEGWISHRGGVAYEGTLTRFDQVLKACPCSNQNNQITSEVVP